MEAEMKIFVSWSGNRSKRVAEILHDWLPNVIQSLRPWMSAVDIEGGARWSADIANELETTQFGIICLTAENLEAPWIHFEAGALSKALQKAYVCPYLLGIAPQELQGPLVQFQAIRAEKEETRKLIHTINHAQGNAALTEHKVNSAFERWWPDLDKNLATVPRPEEGGQPARPEREMMAEILELIRAKSREEAFDGLLDETLAAIQNSLVATLKSEFNLLSKEIAPEFAGLHRLHTAGLIDVHRQMSSDLEAHFGKAAREICILQTWIPNFPALETYLEKALARVNRIRILLLNPSSDFATLRSQEIGYPKTDSVPEYIMGNIQDLTKFCQQNPGAAHKLELRLYNGTPVLSLYASDDTYVLGLFWRGTRAVQGPQFVIEGENSFIANSLTNHFEDIWESGKRYSIG
jgi:TIR domain